MERRVRAVPRTSAGRRRNQRRRRARRNDKGDTLLLLVNAHWQEIAFTLPDTAGGDLWETLVDTAEPDRPLGVKIRPQREQFPLYGRSVALLRTIRPQEAGRDLTSTQVETLRRELKQKPQPTQKEGPLVP